VTGRLAVVVLALIVALAVPGSAVAHLGYADSSPQAAAKKKAKKKKCKKRQVKVKVGKRVSCRPLKKAFPRPKKGDPRKLVTKVALKDWSKFRTRRGKRLPSLPKLVRKVGPGASALLTKATARGLKRLDAMAASGSAARAHGSVLARAAAGCDDLARAPAQTSRFTSGGGGNGPSASVGVTMGPDGASLGIELSGNGTTVSLDMDMGLCDPNEVEAPECPTAVGKLAGEIRYRFKVNIQVTRGGVDVWSQGSEVTRRTKLVGWNEVDAKLDTLDIDDLETSTFRLGGTTRDYPPITIRTKLERGTTVDMRSGSFEPRRSNVEVTINMEGLFGPDRDEAESDAERKARTDADQQFRAVVQKAIDGYKTREAAWQDPPKCATLKFNPEKNRLTLNGSSTGSFTATAIAKSDGNPSELDARLSGMQNAAFSPIRAGGQRARFNYDHVVATAPPGSKVRVKVRATSKAGVAEDTWEQPLKPPFGIDEIAGNFSGSYTRVYSIGTAHVTWTASGTFVRQTPPGFAGATGGYNLKAGIASYHFSGQTITEHADCDMSGNAVVDLFQKGGGSIGVQPVNFQKPFEQGPHLYSGSVSLGPDPKVTLTMQNCGPGAESEEGKQYEWPVGFPPLDMRVQHQSPDGIHYNGSFTETQSGITNEWTWVMTGRKKP
jgi:hypothetical protein